MSPAGFLRREGEMCFQRAVPAGDEACCGTQEGGRFGARGKSELLGGFLQVSVCLKALVTNESE